MTVNEKIADLRSRGLKVRIQHTRLFKNVASVLEGYLDHFLTKYEHTMAVENKSLKYVDGTNVFDAEGEELKFGKQSSPTGGFVKVVIVDGDKEYVGKKNFGKNQPFNKRVGLIAAFNLACFHAGISIWE